MSYRVATYAVEIPGKVPVRVFDKFTEAEKYAKKLSVDYKMEIENGHTLVGVGPKNKVNFWKM